MKQEGRSGLKWGGVRLALALALLPACGTPSEAAAECWSGTNGCPCYGNGTCDAGLMCQASVCSPAAGTGGSSSAGAAGVAGASAGTGGSSANVSSAPKILSLSANSAVLTENDTLVIAVVATDPDGIDDLIGGSVKDPLGGGTYGSLGSSAAEGSYGISLTWDQINTTSPIDAPSAGAARTFRVQLFDVAGNGAEGDVTVTFACSDSSRTACAGDCVWLDSSNANCGACHNSCDQASSFEECESGHCIAYVGKEGTYTCDEICAEAGRACLSLDRGLGPYAGTGFTCDEGTFETCAERAPSPSCYVDCTCE